MPDFETIETEPADYLYVERETTMDPEAIGAAMAEALGTVFGFIQRRGIAPAGPPMSVYYDHDPDRLAFRAGVPVAAADAARAEGEVKADRTPGGRVLHFTHVGPYSTLRDDHGAMMAHMQAEGLAFGAPTWESYVDDPGEVPEETLRTEVYVTLA